MEKCKIVESQVDHYTKEGRKIICDRLLSRERAFTPEEVKLIAHILEGAYSPSIWDAIWHSDIVQTLCPSLDASKGEDMLMAGILIKCFREMKHVL